MALVSDEDYEVVRHIAWHRTNRGYVASKPGRSAALLMHRMILGVEPGDPRKVDHRNRVRHDNQRSNLRIGTQAENLQNVAKRVGDFTSQYRGVSWDRNRKLWRSYVCVGRKSRWLGRFATELEAARVAQQARVELMPFTIEQPL